MSYLKTVVTYHMSRRIRDRMKSRFAAALAVCLALGAISGAAESAPSARAGRPGVLSLEDRKACASIRTLYRMAAQIQYSATKPDGTIIDARPNGVLAAGDLYGAILKTAAASPGLSQTVASKVMLSRVYSEIAWTERSAQLEDELPVKSMDLVRQALELDPQNAVGWYELAEFERTDCKDGSATCEQLLEQHFRKALELDPNFPEAWLGLCLHYLRVKDFSNADQARARYLAMLKDFKPELHFYDTGYPSPREHITDGGNGFVQRKVYRDDPSRFDLASLIHFDR